MRVALLIVGITAFGGLGPPRTDAAEDASKKQAFLDDKSSRAHIRRARLPALDDPPLTPITLINVWTDEHLAVFPTEPPSPPVIDHFLRCHYTNQPTRMDHRLLGVLLNAARKFQSHAVQIVSGFRSAKYNLMLRKKGHEVARESQHPLGQAVDFRIPAISIRQLRAYMKALKIGGVGYYPETAFVHADVGRVRYWRGH